MYACMHFMCLTQPDPMVSLPRGKIKGVIKELIQRRVKLKTAERLAENLASQVQSHLSEKEKRIRQEYETRLERCVRACPLMHCVSEHVQANGGEGRGIPEEGGGEEEEGRRRAGEGQEASSGE